MEVATRERVSRDDAGEADAPALDTALFDPRRPVPAADRIGGLGGRRIAQYRRRAAILAIIRQLLIDHGHAGVTMRRIAEISGFAVQTIYNLVGPRELAIVEAISEYPLHLARAAAVDLDDPEAIVRTIEWQGRSVRSAPEFCRQVCLLSFGEDRRIFYAFRDRQMKMVAAMLMKQKRRGTFHRLVDCRHLAETLTLYASAMFTEWIDRPRPMDELYARLRGGYLHILHGATNLRW